MKYIQIYKGFNLKQCTDHQTRQIRWIGTYMGLRLTADTLAKLKEKIDSRFIVKQELKRLEFKRNCIANSDYETMYLEAYEVHSLVNHVVSYGISMSTQGAY